MRSFLVSVLLALICLAGSGEFAMGQTDAPFVNLRFNRQNNFTWITSTGLFYEFQKGKYGLDVRGQHDNIYNSSQEDNPFIQLYLRLSLWQHYELGKKLNAVSWLDLDQYLITRNEKYSLYGGVAWKPLDYLEVVPLLGYSFDRRSEKLDQGISPALRLKLGQEIRDGVSVHLMGFGRMKFIDPRIQANYRLVNEWNVELEGNSGLMTGVRAASHELDDYSSSSVQKIISDTLNPVFNLRYEFAQGLMWTSSNQISLTRRKFNFSWLKAGGFEVDPISGDTTFAEFNNKSFAGIEVQTRQELSLRREKFSLLGAYEYQLISRKYDLENSIGRDDFSVLFLKERDREKEKDFVRSQQKIEVEGAYEINSGQRLSLSYQAQYMQFDTPSDANFNDRDELTYLGALGWSSRWNGKFRTSLTLSGNFRHLAYLFKERSQDNYKQRSLRLDFVYSWDILSNLNLEGLSAVYVTYNVKDFVDFNNTDRSTRNLENNFKLTYKPVERFQMQFSFARKEFHQSYLDWEAFTESTLDTNVFFALEQSDRYFLPLQKKGIKLYGDLGYRHYLQTKKQRSAMFDLANLLTPIYLKTISMQTGPTSSVGYQDRRGSAIELRVWWQTQVRRNRIREGGSLNALVSPLQEEELRKVNVSFRPFVYLNLNYFFGR